MLCRHSRITPFVRPVCCSPDIRSSAATNVLQNIYSRYFLVPKRDGGLWPILNLRQLFLKRRKFNILTMKQLLRFVRLGDWFTTVDLKNAYLHVPIRHGLWKYLRFSFQGTAY